MRSSKQKREKIIINGNDYKTKDGTAVRDFIHVTDIADMHVLAANNLLKMAHQIFIIAVMGMDIL